MYRYALPQQKYEQTFWNLIGKVNKIEFFNFKSILCSSFLSLYYFIFKILTYYKSNVVDIYSILRFQFLMYRYLTQIRSGSEHKLQRETL